MILFASQLLQLPFQIGPQLDVIHWPEQLFAYGQAWRYIRLGGISGFVRGRQNRKSTFAAVIFVTREKSWCQRKKWSKLCVVLKRNTRINRLFVWIRLHAIGQLLVTMETRQKRALLARMIVVACSHKSNAQTKDFRHVTSALQWPVLSSYFYSKRILKENRIFCSYSFLFSWGNLTWYLGRCVGEKKVWVSTYSFTHLG